MRAQFPAARNCTNCALLLWSQSEATYSANTYDGSLPAGTPRFIDGDRRIVLTAPNAVNYFRGEYQHKTARWTGSLVESLASASGFAALAAASRPLRSRSSTRRFVQARVEGVPRCTA